LSEDIENLKSTVKKTLSDTEAENWTDIPVAVKKIKGLLQTFEDKWRERDKQFRPLI
jgi:hypothetical protein